MRSAEGRCCALLRRYACALSELDGNQLSGSIPSSLASLIGLTFLCVRSAKVGHFVALMHLTSAFSSLNGNQLSGSIPSTLGSLTGLQQLYVCRAAVCN